MLATSSTSLYTFLRSLSEALSNDAVMGGDAALPGGQHGHTPAPAARRAVPAAAPDAARSRRASRAVPFSPQPDSVLVVYRCTHTHWPRPPPWPCTAFPSPQLNFTSSCPWNHWYLLHLLRPSLRYDYPLFNYRIGANRQDNPAKQISAYHSLDPSYEGLRGIATSGDWV